MPDQISLIGLVVALGGAPAVLLLAKLVGLNPFSWEVRLSFWGVAGLVMALVIFRYGELPPALSAIGLASPSVSSVTWGLGAGVVVSLAMGLSMAVVRKLGLAFGGQAVFEDMTRLSATRRLFIVVTAAVVEEVLYRGSALSFGADVFGGTLPAAIISVAAFTLAHFRWRAAHLINVAVAAIILTALYLYTGDLFACMIAHLIVDAAGFLIVPALMRRRAETQ